MPISPGFWEWGCPKRGDAHVTVTPKPSTKDLGTRLGPFWKRYYKVKHNRQETGSKLISYPDLLLTKPKARSRRVRKFNSF